MNFSQKFGLFILIVISIAYVYFSFFSKDIELPTFNNGQKEVPAFNPLDKVAEVNTNKITHEHKAPKVIKIYVLGADGELVAVNRTCDSEEESCFKYAINELMKAPSRIEKAKGYTSEIPQTTKILSIRESANAVQVDLSSDFEAGGGAESTYMRIKQVIKTVNANSKVPVYLYINGKQANVIGGEGIMIKQPLSERSFDE